MKKLRFLLIAVLCALTALTFTACGTPDSEPNGDDTVISSGATQTPDGNEGNETPDGNENEGNNDGGDNEDDTTAVTKSGVLIAYFSLAENLDNEGNVLTSGASMTSQGDIARLAEYIREYTGGEIFSIRTVKKYPNSFQAVVDENHAETENPALQSKVADMGKYDTVFLGYPVWASNIPRAIRTFIAENNLSGKTVIPFCSHDGYGAGSSVSTIRTLSNATLLDGFVIRGTQVPEAQDEVNGWLERIGIKKLASQTEIELVIGGVTLTGVLNDTAVAKEFLSLMPQTMRLSRYADREYYGSINGRISAEGERKRTFKKGEISYCPANNTFAVWFDKEEQTLGMDIISIGEITSDYSALFSMPSSIELTARVANGKILIAYFTLAENISLDGAIVNSGASISSSGNASVLAGYIREHTQGDLFSITVTNPYPNDYNECLDRVVKEKEQNARPRLKNTVENMDGYDIVFLGFPNWSYTVPMAVNTFLESYDFGGKTVIPFCCHGTGGLANTVSDIRSVIPEATVSGAFGISRDDMGNAETKIGLWLYNLGIFAK